MPEWLVAGIGSPQGADRLGWAVVEALAGRLDDRVRLVACRTPAELTPLLLRHDKTIVIDALLGGGVPGTIRCLSARDLPEAALRLSSHGHGLVEAVQLACALGMPEDALQLLLLEAGSEAARLDEHWIVAAVAEVERRIANDRSAA